MDNDALRRLIAARRADAQRIETEIIIACEQAACRSRYKRNRPTDWNNAAWRRYVRAATQTPHRFRASLRKIYDEINALERLAQEPQPAARRSQHVAKDIPCQNIASCLSKNSCSATARNS